MWRTGAVAVVVREDLRPALRRPLAPRRRRRLLRLRHLLRHRLRRRCQLLPPQRLRVVVAIVAVRLGLSKISVKYAKIPQNMPKIRSNFPKFQSEFRTG